MASCTERINYIYSVINDDALSEYPKEYQRFVGADGSEGLSKGQKAKFSFYCFANEKCKHDKRLQANRISYNTLLADWLQGLPTSVNIDYWDDEIEKIGKSWGFIVMDSFVDSWFKMSADALIQIWEENGIKYWDWENILKQNEK